MNKKNIYVLSFFKRHPVKCLPTRLFSSMQSSSPEDTLRWDWWSCSEASLFPRPSVGRGVGRGVLWGGDLWRLSWCCSAHGPGQLCLSWPPWLLGRAWPLWTPFSRTEWTLHSQPLSRVPRLPAHRSACFLLAQKSSFCTTESKQKSMEGSASRLSREGGPLRGRWMDIEMDG